MSSFAALTVLTNMMPKSMTLRYVTSPYKSAHSAARNQSSVAVKLSAMPSTGSEVGPGRRGSGAMGEAGEVGLV